MSSPATSGPPRWLAAIPGYSSYQDKEQRRLVDRALREALATRLATSVQGLQRLSAALASGRRFDQLAAVDALTGRVQHLMDRLRAAPEGYRGLFEHERVDAAVLDQLAAFDAALAGDVDRVGALVVNLPVDGSPPLASAAGEELATVVERLHARLDARGRVLSGGQALAPDEALAVLADHRPVPPPLAFKPGDAISYGGIDYLVDAAVTFSGDRSWAEYRLRDGAAERWLVIDPAAVSLLAPVAAEEVMLADDGSAAYAGQHYRPHAHGQATAAIDGPSGSRRGVAVSYQMLVADPDGVLSIQTWGTERRQFVGARVDRDMLTVYPSG